MLGVIIVQPFFSSHGKTVRPKQMYKSSYEDNFDNVETKEHPQPGSHALKVSPFD